VDVSTVGNWLTEPLVGSVPGWMVLAGAVVAYMMFAPGGSDYRAARKTLDAQHRGYRRAATRIAAA
jgi:hypothetical protein